MSEKPSVNGENDQQSQTSSKKEKVIDEKPEYDPLVKFKEHERERQRERKIKTYE